jgi:hypothetical protein
LIRIADFDAGEDAAEAPDARVATDLSVRAMADPRWPKLAHRAAR